MRKPGTRRTRAGLGRRPPDAQMVGNSPPFTVVFARVPAAAGPTRDPPGHSSDQMLALRDRRDMRTRQPDAATAGTEAPSESSGLGPGGPRRPSSRREVPPAAARRGGHLAARAARWSVRHRGLAVAGWLLAVVALVGIGSAIGTHTLQQKDWNLGE